MTSADADQLLTEIRDLVIAWRRGRDADGPRRVAPRVDGPMLAAGDGIADRITALDEALTAASGHLPAQWAQATAAPMPAPADVPPELQTAAKAVETALAGYRKAETAKQAGNDQLTAAGKALGEARLQFQDLARRADLERP